MNAKRFSAVMRKMGKIPSQQAAAISRDIKKEIERNMSASQDPYGRPWRPKSDGRPSRLKKTGAGRASIVVAPTSGAGFKITVGKLYMMFHQFGGASHLRGTGVTRAVRYANRKKHKDFGRDKDRSSGRGHPPQRMFLPFDRLPDRWGKIIVSHYEKAAAGLLK